MGSGATVIVHFLPRDGPVGGMIFVNRREPFSAKQGLSVRLALHLLEALHTYFHYGSSEMMETS